MWYKNAERIVAIKFTNPKSEVTELHNPSDVTFKWPVSWDGRFELIWWGQWMYSTNLVRLLNPLLPKAFGVSQEYQNCN